MAEEYSDKPSHTGDRFLTYESMYPMKEYDSTNDTLEHIDTVRRFLRGCIRSLTNRARVHDRSKLEPPEKEGFDIYTPKLRDTTYGSDEYEQYRKELGVVLDHHYANNDHHPEHYTDGMKGMNLMSLVEMFCDWKAATMRHTDGDLRRSIEQNQARFGYSDDLKSILLNTVPFMEHVQATEPITDLPIHYETHTIPTHDFAGERLTPPPAIEREEG